MDNLITGLIAAVIFIAFVAGLAETINTIPFAIIVFAVIAMMLVDLGQSVKQGFREDKKKAAKKK
jgi:uncharacterized membrane protein YccF (DUF307 family)